jgi:hypothetical protein
MLLIGKFKLITMYSIYMYSLYSSTIFIQTVHILYTILCFLRNTYCT